jgi:integrase
MARIDYIQHEFRSAALDQRGVLLWTKVADKKPVEKLPQIYWADNRGWEAVNLWIVVMAESGNLDIETIKRKAKHLSTYANFTEAKNIDWRHFPVRQSEQVLRKFRKYLIEKRDSGILAASTVTNCMNSTIEFYRFGNLHDLVGNDVPMWNDRLAVIPFHDKAGFKRAMTRLSSDLSIPNRKPVGIRLEDGLLPLNEKDMRELLVFSANFATLELHLMLSFGFFCGPRLGTVITMTVSGLQKAREDPLSPGIFLLPVGPGTKIATKFSVKGDLMVPKDVLVDLKRYAFSTRRLLREAKAEAQYKDILFLTRSGRPYSIGTVDGQVRQLRRRAVAEGLRFMQNFKFHQSRATFGTWLMKLLLEAGASVTEAIEIVRDAMLHKDERTTMLYVKFNRNTRAKTKVGAEFGLAFTGLQHRDWNKEQA